MRCRICRSQTSSSPCSSDSSFPSLDVNNQKFRKLVGKDAKAETMERESERVFA